MTQKRDRMNRLSETAVKSTEAGMFGKRDGGRGEAPFLLPLAHDCFLKQIGKI